MRTPRVNHGLSPIGGERPYLSVLRTGKAGKDETSSYKSLNLSCFKA